MFKCAGHHAFHARMPQILGFRRHRHRDEASRPRRHHDVGVALADIDGAGLQRHRLVHLDHIQMTLPVKPSGKRAGETRRQMLGDQYRPRKVRRQLRQHDVERGRAAGRGADQHQSRQGAIPGP